MSRLKVYYTPETGVLVWIELIDGQARLIVNNGVIKWGERFTALKLEMVFAEEEDVFQSF